MKSINKIAALFLLAQIAAAPLAFGQNFDEVEGNKDRVENNFRMENGAKVLTTRTIEGCNTGLTLSADNTYTCEGYSPSPAGQPVAFVSSSGTGEPSAPVYMRGMNPITMQMDASTLGTNWSFDTFYSNEQGRGYGTEILQSSQAPIDINVIGVDISFAN